MAMLMLQEDRCREVTFDDALLAPRKQRKPKFTGAHIGYELARRNTTRFFCCAGCGARLFRPQDVLRSDKAADVAVTDSETTFCLPERLPNVLEDKAADVAVTDSETTFCLPE